jgi:heptosyltransferase-2/heptosyltransferase-3
MEAPKRILFFRLGAVGDVLLTTPAVKKAKELFPGAEIHYLVEDKAAPVLENNPYIDRIIRLTQVRHYFPRDFGIFFVANFLKKQFSGIKYDYFFDLESSYYSVYVSFFIKALKKFGFRINQKKRVWYNGFYDKRLDYSGQDRYIANRYIELLKLAVEFDGADLKLVLSLSEAEKAQTRDFYSRNNVAQGDKVVLFGVSGSWPTKRWPDLYWVELAKMIHSDVPGARIFVLWGPGDPKELLDVLGVIDHICVIPEMGLRELITVIAGGSILIANDGAPRHIGQALGLKTVGLFGPTNEKGWANPDKNNIVLTAPVDCRPCDRVNCEKDVCMAGIKPGAVYEAVKKLL